MKRKLTLFLFTLLTLTGLKSQQIITEPSERYGQHTDETTCGIYSSDNQWVITGGWDGLILVYKNHDSVPVFKRGAHLTAINCMALSRDGKALYSAGMDLMIKQFETGGFTPVQTFKGHTGNITSIVPDAVGKFLFSSSMDGTIRVWDLKTPGKVKAIQAGQEVYSLALSLDGRFIFAGLRNGAIAQYDLLGKLIRTFEGHKDAVRGLCYGFNNKYLYSASDDKTLQVWDLKDGKSIRTIKAHTWSINSLQQTADGKLLLTSSSDGTSKLFDVESGKELVVISSYGTEIRQAFLSPDKRMVLLSAKENSGRENWASYAYKLPYDSLFPSPKKDTTKVTNKPGPGNKPGVGPNKPGGNNPNNSTGQNAPNPNQQKPLPPDSVRVTQVVDSTSVKTQQKVKENSGKKRE